MNLFRINSILIAILLQAICTLNIYHSVQADELDDKAVVFPAQPKLWQAFSLSDVRLLPESPFYKAMKISQQYLLDADVERMLNWQRRQAGIEELGAYPGSNQTEGTRPAYWDHYLSGISLMYAQSGDHRFLERVNYMIDVIDQCHEKMHAKNKDRRAWRTKAFDTILAGKITVDGPDEFGYPWGGTSGNFWYGTHKELAAFRDAYLYTDNEKALKLYIGEADEIADFVLKVNPDLFDDMLDLEHGGMNEVFADLYALTGDQRYMDVSMKFNHQKVVLNIADGNDILYGRHANAQIPIFAGTARQYQLTGDEVSRKATENFLDIVFHDHTTCIGGNGCYERFGRPGEITKRLGFTSCETCNSYNMLKVALNYFESTGDLHYMDYYEKTLYNHILASQDPNSGGVTYYTALRPGSFKSYSKVFDLDGVWCCVGTGMENHSKYGKAIYFHNNKDLYVNLFIPSELNWKEEGFKCTMETNFPEDEIINIRIDENQPFNDQIYLRYPSWLKRSPKIWINEQPVKVELSSGGYIRLSHKWKQGDVIRVEIPLDLHLEEANDDPYMSSVFYGPLVLAGELGADKMPGSDLVRVALEYKNWVTETTDIPVFVANKIDLESWLIQDEKNLLKFKTKNAGILNGKSNDISLIPFYQMHHQRYSVYWKIYSPNEIAFRKKVVQDEVNPALEIDEKAHNLEGEKMKTSAIKDDRHFWENNRIGRFAEDGGWFSYDLKINPEFDRNYLVVTYWGGAFKNQAVEVIVNGKTIKSENLYNRWPLTYYEETYELTEELIEDKDEVTVQFKAPEGMNTGHVFGVKITSNPKAFPNYLFY
ncbi:beta-L-arabinofuranosidase domain-containing protein [Sunxiuqinia sp. A32]|uniref:beta-L-arabinofuranosidase domain-containing protein n=1 Tax=Sunxiuqinia sp. A32 TaxID=3461496 RepID=UPI00404558D6